VANILEIIPHPKFDSVRIENDIALLHTEPFLEYEHEHLTSEYQIEDKQLNIYGWGSQSANSGIITIKQKTARLPATWTTYSAKCIQNYASKGVNLNPESTLCVGDLDRGGASICHGDAGVPALDEKGNLYGIASFTIGCGKPGYPGVFTAVAKYRDWISVTTSMNGGNGGSCRSHLKELN